MFHDKMVFILYTKEEAKALGQMLSAEGILWVDGTDPACDVFFTEGFTLWFLSSHAASPSLSLTWMGTISRTKEDCLNYARDYGYEPPIEFRAWAPGIAPCEISSIDELI